MTAVFFPFWCCYCFIIISEKCCAGAHPLCWMSLGSAPHNHPLRYYCIIVYMMFSLLYDVRLYHLSRDYFTFNTLPNDLRDPSVSTATFGQYIVDENTFSLPISTFRALGVSHYYYHYYYANRPFLQCILLWDLWSTLVSRAPADVVPCQPYNVARPSFPASVPETASHPHPTHRINCVSYHSLASH